MVEITFSNYLNKTEGGTSELFMRKTLVSEKVNDQLNLVFILSNF